MLFSLPIAISLLFAIMAVLGAPKKYVSGASLYVDTPVTAQSSTDPTAPPLLVPPAQQEQQIISELLTTRTFRMKVGRGGPLANYLAHHSDQGWSPMSLLSALRTKPSRDYRIMSALTAKHVITTVEGPQLLAIELDGPTPAVAEGTLRALISEFMRERTAIRQSRAQQSLAVLGAQVQAAKKVLAQAQENIAAASTTDPQYKALQGSARLASTRYVTATNAYHEAQAEASGHGNDAAALSVYDQPTLPTGAKSGKKKALMAIFAGLFVGGLLSFGGVAAFTRISGGDSGGDERVARPKARSVAGTPSVAAAVAVDHGARLRPSAVADEADLQPAEDATDPIDDASSDRHALKGKVIAVWDEGDERQSRPVWTIRQANGDVALVPGNIVWMVGDPGRQAVIRNVRKANDGAIVCEVEITAQKLAEHGRAGRFSIAAGDTRWVGTSVVFVRAPIARDARAASDGNAA